MRLLAAARTPATAECFTRDESLLVEQAKTLRYGQFARCVAYWAQLADPLGRARGPSFLLGRSALELFESRSRVGRLMQRATGRGAEGFERIHIDTNSGYVLDGELFDPRIPRTIAVSAGPSLRFATI